MPTLYTTLLGDRFAQLSPSLQSFFGNDGRASGRMTVSRAPGRARNLVASALGLPPAGDYPLALDVSTRGAIQHWDRRFASHQLITRQRTDGRLLLESAGAGCLGFELCIEAGALFFVPRKAWVLGIRVPLALAPSIDAENHETESGGWRVLVRFRVPALGFVGQYDGEVWPERS